MNRLLSLAVLAAAAHFCCSSPLAAPGKRVARCANMFDESCINGGVIGSGQDEAWLTNPSNTPGKRSAPSSQQAQVDLAKLLGSLADLYGAYQRPVGRRCANLFDESCINAGVPGAGLDESWLTGGKTPGRR